MEWKTDLNILQQLPIPSKRNVLRILYHIITEHKGKNFKDLEDLLKQCYPELLIQRIGAGVNVKPRGRGGYKPKRPKESPFWEAPDIEEDQ